MIPDGRPSYSQSSVTQFYCDGHTDGRTKSLIETVVLFFSKKLIPDARMSSSQSSESGGLSSVKGSWARFSSLFHNQFIHIYINISICLHREMRGRERDEGDLKFIQKHGRDLNRVPARTCIIACLNQLSYRCHN